MASAILNDVLDAAGFESNAAAMDQSSESAVWRWRKQLGKDIVFATPHPTLDRLILEVKVAALPIEKRKKSLNLLLAVCDHCHHSRTRFALSKDRKSILLLIDMDTTGELVETIATVLYNLPHRLGAWRQILASDIQSPEIVDPAPDRTNLKFWNLRA